MRISKKMQQAFLLKYEGNTYEEISEALSGRWKPGTLAVYFSKGKKWHDAYVKFESEQSKAIVNEARTVMKRNAVNAAKVQVILLNLVKQDPKVALQAAKDILDRAGLKPVDVVVTPPESKVKEITDWFQENAGEDGEDNE